MNLNDKNLNPNSTAACTEGWGQEGATLWDMYFASAITGMSTLVELKNSEIVSNASDIATQALAKRAELFKDNQ